jgi:HEPN domain-containing protein
MYKTDLLKHWIESSDRDFETMLHLLERGDYQWSLFIGHLVIEKLLKACYVNMVDNRPPLVHNLLRLAEKSGLELTEDQKDFLVTVTTFNIRARYDDYKLEFYKTCTREFTENWIDEIKGFRKWIKEQHLKL